MTEHTKIHHISPLLLGLASCAVMGDNTQYTAAVNWDSRYVTEGRDNLQNEGLWSAQLDVEQGIFNAGFWYGRAEQSDYQEWNLAFAVNGALSGIEYGLGYTYLIAEADNDTEDDHEVSLSLVYPMLLFSLEAEYVYSVEAEGSFVTLAGRLNPLKLTDELSISAYLLQGYDFDYATDVHDGVNHLELGAEAEYQLAPQWSLATYMAHSWAQADVKLDTADDEFWGGISLRYQFE